MLQLFIRIEKHWLSCRVALHWKDSHERKKERKKEIKKKKEKKKERMIEKVK